tara:strand:+ start:3783 stop:3980 length:198 start_codon:yes stop_codon:yes gene_type:complete
LKPKHKIQTHTFSIEKEMERCKNDPTYFYEKYWLPYALGVPTSRPITDTEKFLLETYWKMGNIDD